jgi:Family of unknown function (DUF6350)
MGRMTEGAIDRAAARVVETALGPRPLALATVLAGIGAAALGLLACAVAVLLGWATATGSSADTAAALRASAQVWLAAHHVSFAVPGGTFGLLPLGLAAVPAAALIAAGRWAARVAPVGGMRTGVAAAAGLAATYAVATAAVSGLTGTPAARPQHWQALASGELLGLVFGGLALLRAAGLAEPLRGLAHAHAPGVKAARAVVVGAAGAVATLVAAGAMLVAGSLVAHGSEVAAVHRALAPDGVGAVLLTMLGVAYLPNAAIWAVAYAIGPGFAVGAGTAVAPSGVRLGELPSFPILAGLPSHGDTPPGAAAVVLLPVVAGVVAGVLVVRANGLPAGRSRAPVAVAAGGSAGLVIGLLAALAGGPLGGGRLAAVGPSPWQVALAGAGELAAAAAVTAILAQHTGLTGVAAARTGPPADRAGRPRRPVARSRY